MADPAQGLDWVPVTLLVGGVEGQIGAIRVGQGGTMAALADLLRSAADRFEHGEREPMTTETTETFEERAVRIAASLPPKEKCGAPTARGGRCKLDARPSGRCTRHGGV